jgi:hypothetical protein
MSEREADEVARHGEVLRWSSDSDEDTAKDNDSDDSEEPTEFGVVWERVHHQEAVQLHKNEPMVGDNKLELSPVGNTNDHSEASKFPSLNLADFELFLEIMTKKTKSAAPVIPTTIGVVEAGRSRRNVKTNSVVDNNSNMTKELKAAAPVVSTNIDAVEAGLSRRSVKTSSVVSKNSEQDDDFPTITARYQRRRRISEGKQDNYPLTQDNYTHHK